MIWRPIDGPRVLTARESTATSEGVCNVDNGGTDGNYSNWAVGWSAFAAVMLVIGGIFHAIAGLVAIIDDEFYVVTREWVFELDITAWGWILLIVGVLALLAGIGLFTGQTWARVFGVVVASLGAIENFAFLPYYPLWSITMIAVAVAIIWALTAHGSDLARSQGRA